MPEIRDPVHGFIYLSKDEMKIIDSVPFQRLRRIRQLGTSYLVYPSAEHTRFAHSIGVMHVSTLIFDNLTNKRGDLLEWNKSEKKKYRQMLRLAALLHDIAHAPFSHVSDDLFDPSVGSHEKMAGEIILNTELADIIHKIGRPYEFGPEVVAALITGDAFKKEEQFLKSIFDNEIDSDKMDYLLRDSLFTGVKYGNFDLDRILNVIDLFFSNVKGHDNYWTIGIDSDGVEAVEGLILARYFMFTQVYFHRTRRIFDHILNELLKEALKVETENGYFPAKVDEFLQWDDNRIIEYAKKSNSPWAERFRNRKNMRCVYESTHTEDEKFDELVSQDEQIEQYLKKKYDKSQVIIDKTRKPAIKFMRDDIPTINVIDKKDRSKIYSIQEKARIIAKLEKPIYVFRVYADEEVFNEVDESIKLKYPAIRGGVGQ